MPESTMGEITPINEIEGAAPRHFSLKDMVWVVVGLVLIGGPLLWFWVNRHGEVSPPLSPVNQPPEMLFLAPASRADANLYRFNTTTGRTEQLTHLAKGVYDYALSHNQAWVAYSTSNDVGLVDIGAVNLKTKHQIQLTNCAAVQASCTNPAWRADDAQIAYTRRELDEASGWSHTDRVWLVDVATGESALLFDDLEVQTHGPKWSPVGERLGVVLVNQPGILVYDFGTATSLYIPGQESFVGVFSPEGTRLVYPSLRSGAINGYYTHLQMAYLDQANAEGVYLSGPIETPAEDRSAAFYPDGQRLAIARRYLDDRYTIGTQIYVLDMQTLQLAPLIVDSAYNHASLSWSQDGEWLLMQRFHFETQRAEIWLYHMLDGSLQRVYDDAFLPSFIG